jgi:hypothetical protein
MLDAWTTGGEQSAALIREYADFVADLVIRGVAVEKK